MDIDKIIKQNLKALELEANAKIYNQILTLKRTECEVIIGDVIKILSTKLTKEYKQEIYSLAKELMPWRKGPFEIFDTFIDSEWQSFIKFNILKPYLNLNDKSVADIGCNNGYYLFKMVDFGAKNLVGFDPSIRTFLQFSFIDKFIRSGIKYELLGVEHLPFYGVKFDLIFCLGVIYHRSDPIKMLKDLKAGLNSGGEVFLDTMYIDNDGEFALTPKGRYSKIPNIYFVPTIKALQNWCERAKFKDFEILAKKETNLNEQRKTEWIFGESLSDFLDPNDHTKTIEGYPAPKRIYVKLKI